MCELRLRHHLMIFLFLLSKQSTRPGSLIAKPLIEVGLNRLLELAFLRREQLSNVLRLHMLQLLEGLRQSCEVPLHKGLKEIVTKHM